MYLETKAELVLKRRRIRIKRPVSHIYIPYVRADKLKARITQITRGTISLALSTHWSPNSFFISFARPASLYCEEHTGC